MMLEQLTIWYNRFGNKFDKLISEVDLKIICWHFMLTKIVEEIQSYIVM